MLPQKSEQINTLQKLDEQLEEEERNNYQRDLLECHINTNSNSTETSIDNEIDIDSTVWKTVTRNRRCSNSKCDIAYEDNIFVPAGEWVIDTTPEPWELQTCPKCGNKFAVKFTTSDTKFYPSNLILPLQKESKESTEICFRK